MAAIDPVRLRALPLGTGVLLTGAIALTGYNVALLGGLDALLQAWREPASAPIGAIQLLHGWLPRLVVSLLAGAGLALAGTIMQQVLRNPIASPLTLGVAAGAKLALSILTLAAPALLAPFGEAVAVAGGALALAIVLGLTWRRGLEPVSVVLAGLVVSLYFGAMNAGLLLFFEYDLKALLIWGGGALSQHDWSEVRFLAPRVFVVSALLALLARPLAILTLDDHSARGLGLSLQRARLLALAAAVYLAAAVVSAVGIIAFVGLAAPALARQLGARTIGQRLLAAPVIGALLLLLTDQCVQRLDTYTPGLLPTGAVTALIGAPLLLWLLRQVRPRAAPMQTADAPRPLGRSRGQRAWLWLAALAVAGFALLIGRDAAGWYMDSLAGVLDASPWRAPRVVAAACAGLLLALAGTILQRLLRNPMASPEVLGISGGALAGVTALVLVLPTAGQPALVAAGTAGAVITTGGLLWFSRHGGEAPERILLAGIAIKALYDGLIGLVAASGSPLWLRLLNWVSGSTYGVDWPLVTGAAVAVALLAPLVLALHRWLELLGLGAEAAGARGVPVGRAHLVLLTLAAVATAVATLLVGPLSFVGLMAPHMARMLGLRRARAQLIGAAGVGVIVMVLADWAGRTLLVPHEWPAGLAAAFIGGLYFMWLLRRS